MPEFTRLNVNGTTPTCSIYGTGECCRDFHFDMKAVLPNETHKNLCKTDDGEFAMTTTDKSKVNCLRCIAIMRS